MSADMRTLINNMWVDRDRATSKMMFVVVNFDVLAQASDFRIERRQVVFLGLWNRISSRLNAYWQTDWAIDDQAKNLNSIARPCHQRAFSPLDPTAGWLSHLALAIYILSLLISMLWHRQAIFVSKGGKLSSSVECRIRTRGLWNRISSTLNAWWQTDTSTMMKSFNRYFVFQRKCVIWYRTFMASAV